MKNKKLLYVLVPLVLMIWGLILWKVFRFRVDEPSQYRHFSISSASSDSISEPYQLKLKYRDPFLGIQEKSSTPSARTDSQGPVKRNQISEWVNPPALKYYGMVECENTSTGLIEYRAGKILVATNEQVDEIKIIRITEDSLKVSFKNKIFSYAKNE